MLIKKQKLRILDFDIENRPLSYWIPDEPTAEITAIASCWIGDPKSMQVHLLGVQTMEEMLDAFVARYNEADIVCGHYIRKHDLPHINGALLELGRPSLSSKFVSDTKLDMFAKAGIPATQEYLCEILGIPLEKYHMTQNKWRMGNRLTEKGIQETKKRATSDVLQNVALRAKMIELKLLKAPTLWEP